MAESKDIFTQVGEFLDAAGLRYNAEPEKNIYRFGMQGESISTHFLLRTDANGPALYILCHTDYRVPEQRRVEGALATCAIRHILPNGDLEYDITDGSFILCQFIPVADRLLNTQFLRSTVSMMHSHMEVIHRRISAVGEGLLTVSELLNKLNGE